LFQKFIIKVNLKKHLLGNLLLGMRFVAMLTFPIFNNNRNGSFCPIRVTVRGIYEDHFTLSESKFTKLINSNSSDFRNF
jgi:hypothetical protein